MPDPLIALLAAGFIAAIGVLVFRAEKGLLAVWRKARQLTSRVRSEDALKYIHKSEMRGTPVSLESIAGVLHLSLNDTAELLRQIQENGLLNVEDGALRLTPRGRETALHIIRAHRLWERYLAEETGFDEADWHSRADHYEHLLSKADADALAAHLGHPTHDHHGDPIPSASGELLAHGGMPLTTLPVDTPARIVHLEDEPEVVFAQLAAEGLHAGMSVRVIESTPERVRFWANGDQHLLAPIVATNVSVKPTPVEALAEMPELANLTTLDLGESATVIGISPICRGAERRRLMDLGILPGTAVKAEMRSAGGDPTAYNIRGALIALRSDQARLIHISSREQNDENRS